MEILRRKYTKTRGGPKSHHSQMDGIAFCDRLLFWVKGALVDRVICDFSLLGWSSGCLWQIEVLEKPFCKSVRSCKHGDTKAG